MAKKEDNDDVDEYMSHARKALAGRGTKSGAARGVRKRPRAPPFRGSPRARARGAPATMPKMRRTPAAMSPPRRRRPPPPLRRMASTQAAQTALASPAPTVAQTATPAPRPPMPPSNLRCKGALGGNGVCFRAVQPSAAREADVGGRRGLAARTMSQQRRPDTAHDAGDQAGVSGAAHSTARLEAHLAHDNGAVASTRARPDGLLSTHDGWRPGCAVRAQPQLDVGQPDVAVGPTAHWHAGHLWRHCITVRTRTRTRSIATASRSIP